MVQLCPAGTLARTVGSDEVGSVGASRVMPLIVRAVLLELDSARVSHLQGSTSGYGDNDTDLRGRGRNDRRVTPKVIAG